MDVAIAGGHGQIGRRLARLLAARGDRVRGLIRNPDHAGDLREDGAEPVVCDLESASAGDVAAAVSG
ncbi:MAG TPA: NAD(P)H-binding protein, partial [Thermoleophilaceae bacterium]|nr:NAD(P)H-binding protein [Thermoleophilaceae bacterium]